MSSYNREDASNIQSAGAYIPPHMTANHPAGSLRNGVSTGESRFSKDQLLSIYKTQRDAESLGKHLTEIFSGPWNPDNPKLGQPNSWGKRDDAKDSATGPEICWDHEGRTEPLGLQEMDDEEKEACLHESFSDRGSDIL